MFLCPSIQAKSGGPSVSITSAAPWLACEYERGIRKDEGGWGFSVSLCDRPIGAGDVVEVVISPEGPSALGLAARFPGRT